MKENTFEIHLPAESNQYYIEHKHHNYVFGLSVAAHLSRLCRAGIAWLQYNPSSAASCARGPQSHECFISPRPRRRGSTRSSSGVEPALCICKRASCSNLLLLLRREPRDARASHGTGGTWAVAELLSHEMTSRCTEGCQRKKLHRTSLKVDPELIKVSGKPSTDLSEFWSRYTMHQPQLASLSFIFATATLCI